MKKYKFQSEVSNETSCFGHHGNIMMEGETAGYKEGRFNLCI